MTDKVSPERLRELISENDAVFIPESDSEWSRICMRSKADTDSAFRELEAARATIERLQRPGWRWVPEAFLKTAVCPTCDGSGDISHQIGEYEWEQEQCQWCDERKTALSAAPPADEGKQG